MNKKLIAGVVAVGIGLVGADHFIVEYVKQEIPKQTERFFKFPASIPVAIEKVKSSDNGRQIVEHYNLIINDPSLTDLEGNSVTFVHTANIGWFSLNVQGTMAIDEQQDVYKEVLEHFPEFSQQFSYTYNPLSKRTDFIGKVVLNQLVLKEEYEISADLGNIHFSGFMTPEKNSSSIKISAMKVTADNGSADLAGIEWSLVVDNLTKVHDEQFTINKFNIMTLDGHSLSMESSKSRIDGVIQDIAQGTLSLSIDDLVITSVNAQGEKDTIDMDVTVDAEVQNVLAKPMIEFQDKAKGLPMSEYNQQYFKAYVESLSHGIEIPSIRINVNDSSVAGKVKVKAADYAATDPIALQMALVSNVEMDFSVLLDPKLAEDFGVQPGILGAFFVQDGENYKSHILFADGKPTINGNPM